jgi:hypothetical protein
MMTLEQVQSLSQGVFEAFASKQEKPVASS